jgi:hypothetical protein
VFFRLCHRLSLTRALREALEKGSKDDIPQVLRLQATHYFGSLRNAFIALKQDQRLLRGWSEQKIITVLSGVHRRKEGAGPRENPNRVSSTVKRRRSFFCQLGVRLCMLLGSTQILYFVRHKWRKR